VNVELTPSKGTGGGTEEQLQQAGVAKLGEVLGRRPEPFLERVAALPGQPETAATAAAFLAVFREKTELGQTLRLSIDLIVTKIPKPRDRHGQLLQLVRGRTAGSVDEPEDQVGDRREVRHLTKATWRVGSLWSDSYRRSPTMSLVLNGAATWNVVLAGHIAAGGTGLILGPLAMRATKRRGPHTTLGETYHWVMLAVCVTATVLAVLAWNRIWWFLPIAAFSYANAFVGYVAAKRRGRGWLRVHIGGMLGSYIALTTALLVVNLGDTLPIVWFLPTIVGSPMVAWLSNQVDRGRRPRRGIASSDSRA
jgi:hypothetical protein